MSQKVCKQVMMQYIDAQKIDNHEKYKQKIDMEDSCTYYFDISDFLYWFTILILFSLFLILASVMLFHRRGNSHLSRTYLFIKNGTFIILMMLPMIYLCYCLSSLDFLSKHQWMRNYIGIYLSFCISLYRGNYSAQHTANFGNCACME